MLKCQNIKFFLKLQLNSHKLIQIGHFIQADYSHLSNKRGGWNKRGGGAKNAKSLNVEGVINVNF